MVMTVRILQPFQEILLPKTQPEEHWAIKETETTTWKNTDPSILWEDLFSFFRPDGVSVRLMPVSTRNTRWDLSKETALTEPLQMNSGMQTLQHMLLHSRVMVFLWSATPHRPHLLSIQGRRGNQRHLWLAGFDWTSCKVKGDRPQKA